jgi:hypothetical protein
VDSRWVSGNSKKLWEKSRQMMVSWIMCALYLHDTQFKVNRLTFIQSKKDEDSDALVQRCYFIYENQEPCSGRCIRRSTRTVTSTSFGRTTRNAKYRLAGYGEFRRAVTCLDSTPRRDCSLTRVRFSRILRLAFGQLCRCLQVAAGSTS